jgi:hypothetical protein
MSHKKAKKEIPGAIRASVEEQMSQVRISRSARIAELNLDKARIPERPSTTMPGTVRKIIPAIRPSESEKVQIAIDGPGRKYRNLRIENTLTNEHGEEVKLKKGSHVQVTITTRDVNFQR